MSQENGDIRLPDEVTEEALPWMDDEWPYRYGFDDEVLFDEGYPHFNFLMAMGWGAFTFVVAVGVILFFATHH